MKGISAPPPPLRPDSPTTSTARSGPTDRPGQADVDRFDQFVNHGRHGQRKSRAHHARGADGGLPAQSSDSDHVVHQRHHHSNRGSERVQKRHEQKKSSAERRAGDERPADDGALNMGTPCAPASWTDEAVSEAQARSDDVHELSDNAAKDEPGNELDGDVAFRIKTDEAAPTMSEHIASETTELAALHQAFDRAIQTMDSGPLVEIRFVITTASLSNLEVSIKHVGGQLHVAFAAKTSGDLLILQSLISGLAASLQERYQRPVEIRATRRRSERQLTDTASGNDDKF